MVTSTSTSRANRAHQRIPTRTPSIRPSMLASTKYCPSAARTPSILPTNDGWAGDGGWWWSSVSAYASSAPADGGGGGGGGGVSGCNGETSAGPFCAGPFCAGGAVAGVYVGRASG